MPTTTEATPAARSFRHWLGSRDGELVLDDACVGCLERNVLEEVAADFNLTYREAARILSALLAEGH